MSLSIEDIDLIIPKKNKFERFGSEYNLETDGSIHLNNKFNSANERWETWNQGKGEWEVAIIREDPETKKKEMFNRRLDRWETIPKTTISKDYNVKLNTQNAIEMLLHKIYSNTHIKQVNIRTVILIIIISIIIMLILLTGLSIYVFMKSKSQKNELDILKNELINKSNNI